jgi:P27 family predicted phage terminase small subunit
MAAIIPVRPKRAQPAPNQPPVKALEVPAPPSHLSKEAGKMWREIAGEWVLGMDSLPLLQAALENWDSYQAHRIAVAKQPTFKTDSGNIRANPRAKLAADCLREFRMCLRQLGLEPPK